MVTYTGGYPTSSPSPSPPNPHLSRKPTLAILSAATELEAKQKKESDKTMEMGLTHLSPTTRKYMRKKLPPVPVKIVAEGPAAAPARASLAPISHNIVAGRDRVPASTPVATVVPSPFRPAPAPSSLEEDHSTSYQPSRPRVARHATGSSEARSWRIDSPHPRKNRQPQSVTEHLVDIAIAVSATQKW